MVTGELKNKIDGLWDIFAAGGLVNPLEVIEQITYLMFIHDLDDMDNKRAKESAMLELPYKSIFVDEVKMGDRTIDGTQLKCCAKSFLCISIISSSSNICFIKSSITSDILILSASL